MTEKWRDVELIVEKLHKLMLGPEYEIKSPDRSIKDKITGRLREVDVSIRFKSGYIPMLIVIECRDRGVEDVMWIEQLVTKREKIGANKLIAVSSIGFTEPAKKTADHYGIITQVLSKISPDDIKSWLHGSSVCTLHPFCNVVKYRFDIMGSVNSRIEVNWKDKVFLFENEKYCLDDIFRIEVWEKQQNLFNDVGIDGSKTVKKINRLLPNKYCLQVDTSEVYNIICFFFDVELWYEQQKIPFSKGFRLCEGDEEIIEWAETDPTAVGNGPVKFSVSRKKDSNVMNIGIDFLD